MKWHEACFELAVKLLFVLVSTIPLGESADICAADGNPVQRAGVPLACAAAPALSSDSEQPSTALFLPGGDGGTHPEQDRRVEGRRPRKPNQDHGAPRLVSRTRMDSVRQSITFWFPWARKRFVCCARAGRRGHAADPPDTGSSAARVAGVLAGLRWIDEDAKTNPRAAIHARSRSLNDSLNRQLVLLIAFILSCRSLINTVVLRNIRAPIRENDPTPRALSQQRHEPAQLLYVQERSSGVLSASFNTLVETVQTNADPKATRRRPSPASCSRSSEAQSLFPHDARRTLH
ncbi:MAG: hypothetical protein IPP94_16890 [Ignavibacteria bacterium]|nr:hypothetical protein [Ignavibacteria bacterium]